jgi:hypothetical protein
MDLAFGVKHGMHLFYSTKLDFPGPRMMFAGSFMDGIAPSPTARICTFANNQHDLSGLSGQLRDTPFVKAILSPRRPKSMGDHGGNVTGQNGDDGDFSNRNRRWTCENGYLNNRIVI